MDIQNEILLTNGRFLLITVVDKLQHPNEQNGLDKYVKVINISTGEICSKKLYINTKGLHFKHTGSPPNYLKDFTQEAVYVPFQVIFKERGDNTL